MKGEYWNTSPYCFCKDLSWGIVDDIRTVPVGTGVAAIPGLSADDTALLAASLIGLAALLSLLLCILCCLCPPGLCGALCAKCCGKSAAAAGGAGAAAGAGGAARTADKLHEVDIKLPRAWVESFRGVPIEDFDSKLKALEASGWVGLNDGYGSWFGDDANSMSTLLKANGTGTKHGVGEVDGYKKGHTRMGSAYLTSEEIFGTRHSGTASAGDRAEKQRDYEYGSVISAKYGNELRGEHETDLERSTTTLTRNPSRSDSGSGGGVYNYGYKRDEETRTTTVTTTTAEQQRQQELLDKQEQLQRQQEQLLIQQQQALLSQQTAEVTSVNNSDMNAISEMSISSGYNTMSTEETVPNAMASKVIYEATRETRTVTDESGNVSKTHSETKNGDGAKVLGVISKNGTFRRMKSGDVEYMTEDDIKDVKCLTSDNVMKLYQSYQRARSGGNAGTTVPTSRHPLNTDNVSL